MKLFFHKLRHWEYWPVWVVYAPTFFVWIYFAIRFRSFRFYASSNPAIRFGGFHSDSKFDIYRLLDKRHYPNTVRVEADLKQDVSVLVQEAGLSFPLIVKPDIGCRGAFVKRVNSVEDIIQYRKALRKDFLIQELVKYDNEIGLFYIRNPNSGNGVITGITLKTFLTVTGDGRSTLKTLLYQNPRYELQLHKLGKEINLNDVPANGEVRCLVPFGNHSRGTCFTDGAQLITPKLQHTFDTILGGIEGFNYGRLDIRFESFEALEEGRNFSIIELNGFKSEPTHIYDPAHSFWYGQREIFRHQKIAYHIIKANKYNNN
jgi:hypothetical protein